MHMSTRCVAVTQLWEMEGRCCRRLRLMHSSAICRLTGMSVLMERPPHDAPLHGHAPLPQQLAIDPQAIPAYTAYDQARPLALFPSTRSRLSESPRSWSDILTP